MAEAVVARNLTKRYGDFEAVRGISFVSSSVIFERRLRTFERLLIASVSYLEIVLAKVMTGSLFGAFRGFG